LSGRKRILVVNDNKTFLPRLGEQLEAWGYSVALASSGEQGVEMARGERFDLILLDYTLDRRGHLTAADFAPGLFRAYPGAPVVITSALLPEGARPVPGPDGAPLPVVEFGALHEDWVRFKAAIAQHIRTGDRVAQGAKGQSRDSGEDGNSGQRTR
jgi:CheY-like chemotaxis protein